MNEKALSENNILKKIWNCGWIFCKNFYPAFYNLNFQTSDIWFEKKAKYNSKEKFKTLIKKIKRINKK